jgi:pimeloyl-ACP methyl ester carboxylesterase
MLTVTTLLTHPRGALSRFVNASSGCVSPRPWLLSSALILALFAAAGCKSVTTPIGVDPATPRIVYRQTHSNPVGHGQTSRETREILHRFEQTDDFGQTPDATLGFLRRKVVETRERGILFALAELSYLEGERVRHSVKPWEQRDARDYYLASAVYAWLFLLGDAAQPPPDAFDLRFRAACDIYNFGLGRALTRRRATNAEILLAEGVRPSPAGEITLRVDAARFSHPLASFDRFLVADQFVVRGLSVRNRQSGLGAPLVAMTHPDLGNQLARAFPGTVLLRINGGLDALGEGRLTATLELYSPFQNSQFAVDDRSLPLEMDTTIASAYALNQKNAWRLGRTQFLSGEEKIPTGIYPAWPYEPGRVPVVFVHGTFSSPVTWAEMFNTLTADPELRQRCQFWYFIYNSGNPTAFSATRLREALMAKIKELDPEGRDAALQQMVVIGHSQGGLVTKLAVTDTGEKLLQVILKTNAVSELKLPPEKEAVLRKYTCFEALPFVKRAIFISTPHRGSYGSTGLARKLARELVALPGQVVKATTDMAGLTEVLNLPPELRGTPTSLDSMSPSNPVLLTLADIPLAPGVKGHSIVAVKGDGDYHEGKDGLVRYSSAHVDYVESELVVRGPHSCQDMPPTIEEVRRILHEHLSLLPAIQPEPKEAK